jgi:hypothetical protein
MDEETKDIEEVDCALFFGKHSPHGIPTTRIVESDLRNLIAKSIVFSPVFEPKDDAVIYLYQVNKHLHQYVEGNTIPIYRYTFAGTRTTLQNLELLKLGKIEVRSLYDKSRVLLFDFIGESVNICVSCFSLKRESIAEKFLPPKGLYLIEHPDLSSEEELIESLESSIEI